MKGWLVLFLLSGCRFTAPTSVTKGGTDTTVDTGGWEESSYTPLPGSRDLTGSGSAEPDCYMGSTGRFDGHGGFDLTNVVTPEEFVSHSPPRRRCTSGAPYALPTLHASLTLVAMDHCGTDVYSGPLTGGTARLEITDNRFRHDCAAVPTLMVRQYDGGGQVVFELSSY